MLELQQLLGCFLHQIIDGILVAQPIAAADRVVEMMVETVVGLDNAGRTAFRRAGMTAHRIDLGYEADCQCGIGLCKRNGRPQPAEVQLDGDCVGTTPAVFQVKPGALQVLTLR